MTTRFAGQHFLLACNLGEVFVGRVVGEPEGGAALVGKGIRAAESGSFAVEPFATSIALPLGEAAAELRRIEEPEAVEEVERLLASSGEWVELASYPLLFRWLETALGCERARAAAPAPLSLGHELLADFEREAAEFRCTLYQSPQVTAARELDRLTELEGDLVLEIGKLVNDAAVRTNALVCADGDLARFFHQLGAGPSAHAGPGLAFVAARLQAAKAWARARGRTQLVRDANALFKEVVARLDQVVLEHAAALDTLVTETLAHHGIALAERALRTAPPRADAHGEREARARARAAARRETPVEGARA